MLPGGIGFYEMMIFAVIAVLLFGSRLPEVARNVGQSYQHFRKGLSDIQNSLKVEDSSSTNFSNSNYSDRYDDYDEPSAPQFVPPAEADDDEV